MLKQLKAFYHLLLFTVLFSCSALYAGPELIDSSEAITTLATSTDSKKCTKAVTKLKMNGKDIQKSDYLALESCLTELLSSGNLPKVLTHFSGNINTFFDAFGTTLNHTTFDSIKGDLITAASGSAPAATRAPAAVAGSSASAATSSSSSTAAPAPVADGDNEDNDQPAAPKSQPTANATGLGSAPQPAQTTAAASNAIPVAPPMTSTPTPPSGSSSSTSSSSASSPVSSTSPSPTPITSAAATPPPIPPRHTRPKLTDFNTASTAAPSGPITGAGAPPPPPPGPITGAGSPTSSNAGMRNQIKAQAERIANLSTEMAGQSDEKKQDILKDLTKGMKPAQKRMTLRDIVDSTEDDNVKKAAEAALEVMDKAKIAAATGSSSSGSGAGGLTGTLAATIAARLTALTGNNSKSKIQTLIAQNEEDNDFIEFSENDSTQAAAVADARQRVADRNIEIAALKPVPTQPAATPATKPKFGAPKPGSTKPAIDPIAQAQRAAAAAQAAEDARIAAEEAKAAATAQAAADAERRKAEAKAETERKTAEALAETEKRQAAFLAAQEEEARRPKTEAEKKAERENRAIRKKLFSGSNPFGGGDSDDEDHSTPIWGKGSGASSSSKGSASSNQSASAFKANLAKFQSAPAQQTTAARRTGFAASGSNDGGNSASASAAGNNKPTQKMIDNFGPSNSVSLMGRMPPVTDNKAKAELAEAFIILGLVDTTTSKVIFTVKNDDGNLVTLKNLALIKDLDAELTAKSIDKDDQDNKAFIQTIINKLGLK